MTMQNVVMEQPGAVNAEGKMSRSSPENSSGALDCTLMRGIAWTGAIKWLSQLLSWVSTIVVARLLNPEDYGIVAMAGVFVGFIGLLNEFGLGAAVVALRHLTEEQIASMHSLASLFGVAGFLLTCLVAIPAGRIYAASNIPLVIVVMGAGFAFLAVRSVPSALLERALRFKLLALLEGGQAIVAALVTVGLAWWGVGYWALVVGGVAGHAAVTAVIMSQHPVRYARPSFRSLHEALRFSSHVLVGRISWYVASNADVFIAGRIFGQGIVGAYSFACTLANLPLDKITALLSRVMPAFYSSVQTDPTILRRYLLLLTEGLALLTFPVGVGMALVADAFVPLVLGEQWVGVVLPLQVLSCWAVVRSLFGLISPILFVTGGSRLSMLSGLFCMVVYPLGFWFGSGWGAVGIALAWVAVQPVSWIAPYRHALAAVRLPFLEYLSVLWPAATSTVVMAGGVYFIHQVLPGNSSHLLQLLCEATAGVTMYAAMIGIFHRARLSRFLGMIKGSHTVMI
ncbi:MAG: lipopolysaccharide biosynthesis protein [Nitrospira sp.]|nr:lipopolysaccharide biosynthesis protein [Nitrospira sp.]